MNVNIAKLKELVQLAELEATKFQSGNKSAGVRVRKIMQDLKKVATDVRATVQASKTKPEQV